MGSSKARNTGGVCHFFLQGIFPTQGRVCQSTCANYAENIMENAGLDKAQPGIKIIRRNINSLIYSDDTTLITESQEELKSLLMKIKEEDKKNWFKTAFKKWRSWVHLFLVRNLKSYTLFYLNHFLKNTKNANLSLLLPLIRLLPNALRICLNIAAILESLGSMTFIFLG